MNKIHFYPIHYSYIPPIDLYYPQQHYYKNIFSNILKNIKNDICNIALFSSITNSNNPLLTFFKNYFQNSSIHIFTSSPFSPSILNSFPTFSFHNYNHSLSFDEKNRLLDTFATQWNIVLYDLESNNIQNNIEMQTNELNILQKYIDPSNGIFIFDNLSPIISKDEYDLYYETFLTEQYFQYATIIKGIFPNNIHFQSFIFYKNKPVFLDEITIITPSIRPQNLQRILPSINFDYISRWIIIYDSTKISTNPHQFTDCPYIEEYLYSLPGIGKSGNDQRNFALSLIPKNYNGYIYFLDDDNTIHPNFYHLLQSVIESGPNKRLEMYTFDQMRDSFKKILYGNECRVNKIDSAMTLIPAEICRNIKWKRRFYNADGRFIEEVYNRNRTRHVYIETVGCYYNYV
jgi:hypothetical protein